MAGFEDLPVELIFLVLTRVSDQIFLLKSPILVCKAWCAVIASTKFWLEYHKYWGTKLPKELYLAGLSWTYFAHLRKGCESNYEKNLIKNCSGELTSEEEFEAQHNRVFNEADQMYEPWPSYKYWQVLSNASLGWRVVKNPKNQELKINPSVFTNYPHLNVKELNFDQWFITSYHSCNKVQILHLDQLWPQRPDPLLDNENYEVVIHASQWYCMLGPCIMDLKVTFFGCNGMPIHQMVTYRNQNRELLNHWNYVETSFKTSLKDIKKLHYYHGATCNVVIEDEEEQNQVGVCFAESSLKISFPLPVKPEVKPTASLKLARGYF